MTLTIPSLTQVLVDSIDVTTYVSSWKVTREFGEAISKADLVLKNTVSTLGITFDENNAYHTVEIWRGTTTTTDSKIFNGEITAFQKDGVNILCKCLDELHKLVKAEVTQSFDKDIDTEAGVISEIFETLVEDNTDLTTSVVSSGAVNILTKFICNHADVFERCEKLAEILDWQFYYNPSDDLVYFEPKGTQSNANILTIGTNVIKQPRWSYDKSQLCNKLVIIGAEELVETTEIGQIGVTSGYTQTDILLTKTPFSVKVFCDAVSPPTTLRTGGNESSSTYEYSVDIENKKVVWNTGTYTPGAADHVIVNYSYKLPRPVVSRNQSSIDTHKESKKAFFKSELKNVTDVEEYAKIYVQKYSQPFLSATLPVVNVSDMYAGETISVVDSVQGIDKELLINQVIMVYPYKFDSVVVSDKKLRTSSWGVKTMDRIRRLEEELGKSQDILTQVLDFPRDIDHRLKYMEVQKKTYPEPSADVFILGSTNYGVLGTNKLGDSTGAVYSTIRIQQGKDTYNDSFFTTDFKDAANTTATWAAGAGAVTFTAGQVAQTSSIFYDASSTETLASVIVSATYTGEFSFAISPDGGTTWTVLDLDAQFDFDADGLFDAGLFDSVNFDSLTTGSDLVLRVTEVGGATGTLTNLQCLYVLN